MSSHPSVFAIPAGWLVFIVIVFLYVVRRTARSGEAFPWLYYLFFVSGFPALIYQIVWERALFTIYGVNIQSVTVVVTGFLLGLGLGSLVGGRLSRVPNIPLLALFGMAELGASLFGIFSLTLFHRVAIYTAGSPALETGMVSFALVVIPTMLMGSTLSLLTAHMVRLSGNVGRSVGMLYFVNTLGSAAACFVAAALTMRLLGQSGSVAMAVALNTVIGTGVLALFRSRWAPSLAGKAADADANRAGAQGDAEGLLGLPIAAALVATTGFIALAYEIIWYRLFSFYSGSKAMVFACLLGAYLFGIAIGGLIAHDLASRAQRVKSEYLRLIAVFVVVANLVGFAVAWAMGTAGLYTLHTGKLISWAVQAVDLVGIRVPMPDAGGWHSAALLILLIVAVAAAFLAATFPLICEISLVRDVRAGSGVGILYFSNIVGSALGSFLVGMVLSDIWGVRELSMFLALLGVGLALVLWLASNPNGNELAAGSAGAALVCVGIIAVANPLYDGLYEKLLFKRDYHVGERFRYIVENRSGVITVTNDGTVFGGGAYDGRFNIDLAHDVNGTFRTYAISSFSASPRKMLMIGLSSGSWAQILANHPQVELLTIVEINPGYLRLIPQYPEVADVLDNPKVRIVIDDGRRWLVSHPDRKFDIIVMNTTFNWRENASNLLSVEFLRLARRHLLPGGILYYNTTNSDEVLLTGTTVFPYGLRVGNFLAVSDSPIEVDTDRLRRILLQYRIDGHPVLDPRVPVDAARLSEMLAMTHRFRSGNDPSLSDPSMEYDDSIRARCRGKRIITDDNMGTEWLQ